MTATPDRADVIAGLRRLADLLERIPELPVYPQVTFVVGGDEGVPVMESAAQALAAAEMPHLYSVTGRSRGLYVDLPGLLYAVSYVHGRVDVEVTA